MSNLSEKAITAIRAGAQRAVDNYQGFDMLEFCFSRKEAPCGTAGCIAFEITAANGVPVENIRLSSVVGYDRDKIDAETYANELLGYDADELFYTGQWPSELEDEYENSEPFSLERALFVQKVAEMWIASDGIWSRK